MVVYPEDVHDWHSSMGESMYKHSLHQSLSIVE